MSERKLLYETVQNMILFQSYKGVPMYLSRVELDTNRRSTMAALASLQKLHGAVESAFSGERKRRLWRMDRLGGKMYLLIVSEDVPTDLARIVTQFGTGREAETKCYDALFGRLKPGSRWHFRLTANPVHACPDPKHPGERGLVNAHCSEQFQKKWLMDRAEKHGFTLLEDDFMVMETKWLRFRKQGKNTVTLLSVTYEGSLCIVEPEAFQQLLCRGIGKGKAYGLGMMTVVQGG